MEESVQTGPRHSARGAARRSSIAAAALELIESGGIEAVTHRRAAEQAGVPLAATTYYFSSKDELLQAAMELHVEREAAQLRELARAVIAADIGVEEGIEALVAWQVASLRDHRAAQHAQLELYLRVARTSGPPPGDRWTKPFHAMAEAVFAHFGSAHPTRDARALSALIHGLVIECLTTGEEDCEERVLAPVLRGFLRARLLGDDAPARST
jgi:DNA-binding transcriptional regulator YbjK